MDDKKKFELNDEQLEEVSGGLSSGVVTVCYNRRCAANPAHVYFASRSGQVCPYCGEKKYIEFAGN